MSDLVGNPVTRVLQCVSSEVIFLHHVSFVVFSTFRYKILKRGLTYLLSCWSLRTFYFFNLCWMLYFQRTAFIMRTEQPTKCLVPLQKLGARLTPLHLFKPSPSNQLLTVLLCFSVACFWCQSFGDVSPYMCSYFLVRFGLGIVARSVDDMSLCMLAICNFSYFPIWF